MNFWGSLTHAGDKHDEEISNFSSPSQAGPSWRFCYEFNFASQSSYKSEALSFTVVLSLLFCWISCAITSLGVRWISSGFIASFSQSLLSIVFVLYRLWWLVFFWQKRLILAATAFPIRSRDESKSWYPNGRMLRWIKSNALIGWPETWRYSQTASPLICRENIGSFLSIKGGTMWISRGMIGLSMSLEKSYRSLTLSSILALLITRSVWQFAWVRCCTVLALKLAAIVNYFTTEWFSWMRIVLVLTTIVIHSWA